MDVFPYGASPCYSVSPKGANNGVKRPEGPPATSRGPEGLETSSCSEVKLMFGYILISFSYMLISFSCSCLL